MKTKSFQFYYSESLHEFWKGLSPVFFKVLFILNLLLQFGCSESGTREDKPLKVKTGAEVLIEDHLDGLQGKRVGLVMNPTARIGDEHMLDTLLSLKVDIKALYAPEHGFRGEAGTGEDIEDGIDQATGLPVFSLYGEVKKPTREMLKDIDLLLFDMQDVGARFYTYNVTLGRIMEAAAENDVEVWVLDRPNPAGGDYVAGWVLADKHQSLIGAYPIPAVHGMTMGELAKMIAGEKWIDFKRAPDLKVIPMKGWKRSMKWPDTGLKWYPPSPNLPSFEHAFVYLGTALFEGTTISAGRGTEDPFLTIGSPGTAIPDSIIGLLNSGFPAFKIRKTSFIPESIPGKVINPKFENERCYGISIRVDSFEHSDPLELGLTLLREVMKFSKGAELKSYLEKLSGVSISTEGSEILPADWELGVDKFKIQRQPYLIYD